MTVTIPLRWRESGLAGLLAALAACVPPPVAPPAPEPPPPPPPPLTDPRGAAMLQQAPDSFKIHFETTAGDIIVLARRGWAPQGVDRLYNLVRHGYYDGVSFFRVVPRFVVQFGPHGDPAMNAVWRMATFPDDSVRHTNRRGTLTFATAGPNTRSVQLFFNLVDNARLDAQGFAPLGEVSGGMDTVDRLHAGYGEMPPRGQGPDQSRIMTEGDAYLLAGFPLLDRILRARIVP